MLKIELNHGNNVMPINTIMIFIIVYTLSFTVLSNTQAIHSTNHDLLINVKDYGAIGNDLADDTNGLQNALNALEDNSVIYFPKGTYLISDSVVVPDRWGWQIKGEGAIIKAIKKINGGMLQGNGGSACSEERLMFGNVVRWYRWANCRITGLTFNCNNMASQGLNINTATKRMLIDNCDFWYPVSDGINLLLRGCYEIDIDRCRVTGGDSSSPGSWRYGGIDNDCNGITVQCSDGSITNCIIRTCNIGINIDVKSPSQKNVHGDAGYLLSGNHIYRCKAAGLFIQSRFVNVVNNYFDKNEVYNIHVKNQNNSTPPLAGWINITNNLFLDSGDDYYFNKSAKPVYIHLDSDINNTIIKNMIISNNQFKGDLGTSRRLTTHQVVFGDKNYIMNNSHDWDYVSMPGLNLVTKESNVDFIIDRPEGKFGNIWFKTDGSNRWRVGIENQKENGSNEGSDFEIRRRADNGDDLGTVFKIERQNGLFDLDSGFVFAGSTSNMKNDEIFTVTSGNIFIKDPDGSNRNFDPYGDFPEGYIIFLINTTDKAETIVFDRLGLNQQVRQNQRGIFIYTGKKWLKIYVGS